MPRVDTTRDGQRGVGGLHGNESIQRITATETVHDATLISYQKPTDATTAYTVHGALSDLESQIAETVIGPGPTVVDNAITRFNGTGGLAIQSSLGIISDAGALTGITVNANVVTAGTMATARLGSGTADGTTFLRGDSTWATPSGSGDVVGPGSATDNAIARFDGTTGKLIQNSAGIISDAGVLTGITVDANVITAGTVATARLGSGTADNTTFLRGDQTWATPSGGGNSFTTIDCPSGTDPVADSATDTLQLLAGTGVTVTGSFAATTVTFGLNLGAIDHASLANLNVGDPHPQYQLENASVFFDDISDVIQWTDSGTGFTLTLTPVATISGSNKTITFPNLTGDVIVTGGTQTCTGNKRFGGGARVVSGSDLDVDSGCSFNCDGNSYFNSLITLSDGVFIACTTGASGNKIGTASNQLIGFWGTTPVDQPASTEELRAMLASIGLTAAVGSNAASLNLIGGDLLGVDEIGGNSTASIKFNINSTLEMTLAADSLLFNGGTTDVELTWPTNGGAGGQLGFKVGSTTEMLLEADKITFEAGTTDVGLGWPTNGGAGGQLTVTIGGTVEHVFEADKLTFKGNTVDTILDASTANTFKFNTNSTAIMDWTSGGGIYSRVAHFFEAVAGFNLYVNWSAVSAPSTVSNEHHLWFDSTQDAFGVTLGVDRYHISQVKQTSTADATKTGALTTEGSLIGSGVASSVSLSANRGAVGKTWRFTALGYYSTHSTAMTLDLKVKFGSVVVASTGAMTLPNSVSSKWWKVECYVTIRTESASGTVYAQGIAEICTAQTVPPTVAATIGRYVMANTAVSSAINFTSAVAPDFVAQWGGSTNAANTITCTNFAMEVLN